MRGRLDRVADIEVVGEAASGDEAVEMARKLELDVILMDIKMPGLNGIEATREILRAKPRVGVLMLTMFEDDDSVFAAMRAGAKGYLLKDSGGEGDARHPGRSKRRGCLRPRGSRTHHGLLLRPKAQAATPSSRADRARRGDPLVAQGKSNQEIARQLYVSLKTVRNHVSNILLKLQVADRAQAVIRARESGLGHDST